MHLLFKEFRYDVENQLLYKANDLIPLKRNQAAMLGFFLIDRESIHSKEEILNAVWGNQDVSEQVIFQTISQLRRVLGAEAIKTFSGMGYKWQLKISSENSFIRESDTVNFTVSSVDSKKNTKVIISRKLAAISFMLVAILSIFIIYHVINKNTLISLHVLSASKQEINAVEQRVIEQAFSQSSLFKLNPLVSSFSKSQAFSSPKLAFKKSNLPNEDWLLWGDVYSSEQDVIFRYGLSNEFIQWQGYVQAGSLELLPNAISDRFNQLRTLDIFALKEHELDVSVVRSMLNASPEDPELLLLAAKYSESMTQDDVALSYLQQIIGLKSLDNLSPYKAIAHWKIGKLYKMRGQHLQAHNSLDDMLNALEHIPVGPLHFQYIKTKAWLAYSETDHETMFNTLDKGVNFFNASSTKQPLLMFKLHVLYSILAQKVSEHEKKYFHLSQAQALLLKYQLDQSNLAIIYYHFALFSQYEENNKLITKSSYSKQGSYVIYLEKILKLSRTKDNFWIHDEAIELLVRHHIEQKEYLLASDILTGKAMTPRRQFLIAEILLAQNQMTEAIKRLNSAFQQAIIDYDNRTAIESALKLYQFSENTPKRQAEYLAYLQANTQGSWLKEHLVSIGSQSYE